MADPTSDDLARGAWYALEQAGYLFRDAATLYQAGALPTAVVLAMFGREQLGKYRELLGLWHKARVGVSSTSKDVRPVGPKVHPARQKASETAKVWRDRSPIADAYERHRQRMASMYTDWTNASWSRPVEQWTAEKALHAIADGINDYTNTSDETNMRGHETDFRVFVDAWASRPALPVVQVPAPPEGAV